MVSTRQMTGGSSDESNINCLRTTSTASSSTATSASAGTHPTNVSVAPSSMKAVVSSNILQHDNQPTENTAFGLLGIGSTNVSANVKDLTTTNQPLAVVPSITNTKLCVRADINLLDLPVELLGHIFSFVGFKQVAQLRTTSHQMNQVCSSILNYTFQKLQNHMHSRFQTVKAKMPRRESARRNHPLACECDILETCYMRLSLLQMTFGKHIERKHCCFFPGAILDEVYAVLRYIRTSPSLDRPFKVTDELFDLSTMAMEYFKEHIEPNLPEIAYFTNSTKSFAALETCNSLVSRETLHSNSSSPPQSNMVLRKGIRKIKQGMKRYNNQLSVLRSELRTCKRKATEQTKAITEQQKLLAEQQKQTLEFANRLDETDKKNEELSRKFSTVLQELNKCKTELQYWRSNSPSNKNCRIVEHGLVEHYTMGKAKDSTAEVEQLMLCKECGFQESVNSQNMKEEHEHIIDLAKNQTKARIGVVVNSNLLTTKQSLEGSAHPRIPGQKRKFDDIAISSSTTNSVNVVGENQVIQMNDTCFNPPFALESLAASLSSSTLATTGDISSVSEATLNKAVHSTLHELDTVPHKCYLQTDSTLHKISNVVTETDEFLKKISSEHVVNLTDGEPNSETSIAEPAKPCSDGIMVDEEKHANTCINESNSSENRNSDIIISHNYHNKKLRKVQNQPRLQSNRHINQRSSTNMHAKATRSKISDR